METRSGQCHESRPKLLLSTDLTGLSCGSEVRGVGKGQQEGRQRERVGVGLLEVYGLGGTMRLMCSGLKVQGAEVRTDAVCPTSVEC